MRKMFITLAATSALALGACQSPAADKVEDQAEAQADVIDDQADAMPEGPAKEAMENKADVVEEMGEEKANAMDDNGEIAPSETGVGDTPRSKTAVPKQAGRRALGLDSGALCRVAATFQRFMTSCDPRHHFVILSPLWGRCGRSVSALLRHGLPSRRR